MKKIFFALLLSAALLSSEVFADDSAFQFAKSRQAAISSAGKSIGKEIDSTLDYDYIIKKSMASNWNSSTELQRKEIDSSLRLIIGRSLSKRLSGSNLTKVKWIGYSEAENGITIVKSTIEVRKPSQETFEVEYHVQKSFGTFKVVDVVFDGVSTVETYRSQFQKTIKLHGTDYLIGKLKEKVSGLSITEDDGF